VNRITLEPEYIRAKLWKDIHDVVSLLKECRIDKEKLTGFLEETGIQEKVEQIIGIISDEGGVLKDLDIEPEYLRKALLRGG